MTQYLWLLASITAKAEEKKLNLAPPKIEAQAPGTVTVKESTVIVNNKRYRRIEYKSEVFLLRFQSKDPKNDPDKVELSESKAIRKNADEKCLKTNLPFSEDEARVLGEVKVTSVASVYVEGLHNRCEEFDPRVQWDGGVGLKLKTGDTSDVKIGIESTPGQGLTPKANLNVHF